MTAFWDQHSTLVAGPPDPYLSDGFWSGPMSYRQCNYCDYRTHGAQMIAGINLIIKRHVETTHPERATS